MFEAGIIRHLSWSIKISFWPGAVRPVLGPSGLLDLARKLGFSGPIRPYSGARIVAVLKTDVFDQSKPTWLKRAQTSWKDGLNPRSGG